MSNSKKMITQIGKIVGQSINAYYPNKLKSKVDEVKFKETYQGRIIDCMVGEVDDNYIETPETDAPIVKLEYSKEGVVKVPSIKGKTMLVDADGQITDTPGEGCRLVSVGENEDNKIIILSKNVDNSKEYKTEILIDEPLRSLLNEFCDEIVGNQLIRRVGKVVLNGSENWYLHKQKEPNGLTAFSVSNIANTPENNSFVRGLSNLLPFYNWGSNPWAIEHSSIAIDGYNKIYMYTIPNDNLQNFKQRLKENPVTVFYELAEPTYEEVLNEYGEPILLEGYENGTIYIDSTIVPTTTVRYTPKMESFKTLKEVKIRNTINDFDVANNVIPYMMEVDIKLTELEMSAISTYNIKNIRKMEVLDMISMQERTFKMLERLIRGKSHTKQEMIDRVLLYEQAKRITTEQALELNLIIEEVYGA